MTKLLIQVDTPIANVYISLGYVNDYDKNRYPYKFWHAAVYLDSKYTYSILPISNGPLSPGNGQLSKLHVNKAHLYLRVQKENAHCLSKYITFRLRCI